MLKNQYGGTKNKERRKKTQQKLEEEILIRKQKKLEEEQKLLNLVIEQDNERIKIQEEILKDEMQNEGENEGENDISQQLEFLTPAQLFAFRNIIPELRKKIMKSTNFKLYLDILSSTDDSILKNNTKFNSIHQSEFNLFTQVISNRFPLLEKIKPEDTFYDYKENIEKILEDNGKKQNVNTAPTLINALLFIFNTYKMYKVYQENKILTEEEIKEGLDKIDDEFKIIYNHDEIKNNRFNDFLEKLMDKVEPIIGLTSIIEYKLPRKEERNFHPEITEIIDNDNFILYTGQTKKNTIISIDFGKYKKITDEIKDVCIIGNTFCYLFLKGNQLNREELKNLANIFRNEYNKYTFNSIENKNKIIQIFKKYLNENNIIILRINDSVTIIKKTYVKQKYKDHLDLLYYALIRSIKLDTTKTKIEIIDDPEISPSIEGNSIWLYFLDKDNDEITNKYYNKYLKYKNKYLELKKMK